MPSEGDMILKDGDLNHIEAGLGKFISLCGESFEPASVDRVAYEVADEGWEQSHEVFCMACTQVQNRRAVEGNGGALADAR